MNFPRQLQWLAFITVLINAAAMLSPVINSGDAIVYATLAQHMVSSHDWIRLVLDGRDWLDKPHLPFWITALSFELGGVSALTYILPGFIFHLVGAYYSYRLARMLYDKQTAGLAVLIYVSIFDLMDSSIEVKAEVYLIGLILPACYYWLRYDEQSRGKHLVLGALFTAMAIMTKGIFTLFTIASGLVCLWLYRGQWVRLFSVKWLLALVLSLALTVPELAALYWQFDQGTGSAALENALHSFRFFFWDSQFGRFLNSGPIQNHNGHPLYFVLVFLWAFLPWPLVFFAAIHAHLKTFRGTDESERAAFVFLVSTFLCAFLMFSATKFQMSYYIDIILPFAAILCARFLAKWNVGRPLFVAQMGLAFVLVTITVALSVYVMNLTLLAAIVAMLAVGAGYSYATRAAPAAFRALVCSVLAMNLLYVFMVSLTFLAFTQYGLAYNAAKLLGQRADTPIYVYQMPEVARELALYSKAPCHELDNAEALVRNKGRFYLVVRHDQLSQLPAELPQFTRLADKELVIHKTGVFNKLLQLAKGTWPLETIDFLQYNAP